MNIYLFNEVSLEHWPLQIHLKQAQPQPLVSLEDLFSLPGLGTSLYSLLLTLEFLNAACSKGCNLAESWLSYYFLRFSLLAKRLLDLFSGMIAECYKSTLPGCCKVDMRRAFSASVLLSCVMICLEPD